MSVLNEELFKTEGGNFIYLSNVTSITVENYESENGFTAKIHTGSTYHNCYFKEKALAQEYANLTAEKVDKIKDMKII